MGYPKHIYDAAWRTLDARAQAAARRGEERRAQVLRKTPEIIEIEREMARSAAGVTRAVISAPPNKAAELIEQLAGQNLRLQAKRRALLAQNGFPADYLEEQFGCARCKDKGYIGRDMCACLRDALQAAAFAELGEGAPVERSGFGDFALEYYPVAPDASGVPPRGRMEQILAYCSQYADSFAPGAESILMLGNTGLGKTHLSLAIAAVVTQKGYGVLYTPVQKLMDRLEAERFTYDADKKELYAGHISAVTDCDLLVLDDLGTEFHTQFTASILYNIINSRQVEGRATIISTNLEIAEIEKKYSQRMVSRLVCAYKVLKFAGKDIRFLKRSQA